MNQAPTLETLWDSAPASSGAFDPAVYAHLPEPARRYLNHAMAPGTPLASAVRLRMHGEFRRGGWAPFTAEQVIRCDGEMLWRASMRLGGLPVSGFDALLHGEGRMQWRLFGLIPLVFAEGPDVTRSAVGRVEGESLWLPSLLCTQGVTWAAPDPEHIRVGLNLLGEPADLTLGLTDGGAVRSVSYERWGNPEGGAFHYGGFGGWAEEERTFGGYTIPTRLRIGWHFGTDRFESEGEFFRVTIDHAEFR